MMTPMYAGGIYFHLGNEIYTLEKSFYVDEGLDYSQYWMLTTVFNRNCKKDNLADDIWYDEDQQLVIPAEFSMT